METVEHKLPRKYEDVKYFLDDFAFHMTDKAINQQEGYNFEEKNMLEKDCGCCVGAHLAKFIANSEGRYFGTGCEMREMEMGEICDHTFNVYDWSTDYANWRKKKFGDDDDYSFDGWGGLKFYKKDDHAEEWILSHEKGFFRLYHFRDGVRAFSRILGIDDKNRKDLENFEMVLSAIAHPDGMYWAWSGNDWSTDNIAWALRHAVIAYEIYRRRYSHMDIGKFCIAMAQAGLPHTESTLGSFDQIRVAREIKEKLDNHGIDTISQHYGMEDE